MPLLTSIEELRALPGPVVIAIGVFDGVHVGHRAVLEKALADAAAMGGTAVAVTFHPHPARVLRPEKAPRLLTSTPHKQKLLHKLGFGWILEIPFTREFAEQPPRQFVLDLVAACNGLREICVGHEWCFGKNRSGNLEFLRLMGDELGFEEVGVPEVRLGGSIVSSTRIRAMVETGDLRGASELLGREFTILGTVVEGDRIGRTIGFPTANLATHNEQFPPNGVYAVMAELKGTMRPGVVNIGVRPTIQAGLSRLLELHLFDFNEEIYGSEVEVFFREFIRPEMKFSSLDELKQQIGRDAARAAAILGCA